MFDKEHIEAYQQIKAPDSIRERLSEREEKNAKSGFDFSRLRSYAACLVMVILAGFIIYTGYTPSMNIDTAVLSDGKMLLSQNGVSAASARSIQPADSYHIELDAKDGADIAISCGQLYVWDTETGELLFCGREYSAKGNVALNIDLEGNEKAILSVDGPFYHKKIDVEYAE
ncbi:MAG: hypothetical protein E7267_05595 [Lachnospiraceae bacterium]|nr:hypothetical protein [Lachnospiraceae bacterium]